MVWEDPPPEERFAVKRKRTAPAADVAAPADLDAEPDLPLPPTTLPNVWENPLFRRATPHDFSSGSEEGSDDDADDLGHLEAAVLRMQPLVHLRPRAHFERAPRLGTPHMASVQVLKPPCR